MFFVVQPVFFGWEDLAEETRTRACQTDVTRTTFVGDQITTSSSMSPK